ncbi:hypothetical protein [Aquimarina pacifica]|uniref:hypothetical protein n=1 Tax=Aquimarina pacifica TaxID=1296415 RepID=UPI00046EB617|nr:hypothetical protein [Aquimarina pacifica]
MKTKLILLFLLAMGLVASAQIENSSSIRIDLESDQSTDQYSLSKGKLSTDTNLNSNTSHDLSKYGRPQQSFDMTGNDGFYKPKAPEIKPKWFEEENKIKDEYNNDQYFGNFKNNGEVVKLIYRDHKTVDGDIVRILVNDKVIISKVFLFGQFKGIEIDLIKGFNKIDILALNQGDAGPNTAEFHLYDEQGVLITNNEWNLTTGKKATMIIVKN